MKKYEVVMNFLLFSFGYIAPSEIKPAEQFPFILLDKDNKSINVPFQAALSIHFFRQLIGDGYRTFRFPDASHDDLYRIAKYISLHEKVRENKKKEKKELYLYVNGLSNDALVWLTHNVYKLLNYTPSVLESSLVQRELKLQSLDHTLLDKMSDDLLLTKQYLKQAVTDDVTNKTFLKKLITSNGHQESLISRLFDVYTDKLEEKRELLLPSTKLSLWSVPIVKYIHVGDAIIASLSGWIYPSNPHYNYTLTLYTQDGSKEFKLQDKELDFDACKVCARKDDSLFVCGYHHPCQSGKEGILIVNPFRLIADHVDCSGKTVASFGSNDGLLSFDNQGKIFELSIDAFGYVWREKFDTKISGIKGLITGQDNQLIIWTNKKIIYITEDTGEFLGDIYPFAEYDKDDAISILNIIGDGVGEKFCVKLFMSGIEQNQSLTEYWMCDCNQFYKLASFSGEKEVGASFSADSRLFIISSCENSLTTHEYFDLGCKTDENKFSSWKKKTEAQLLAVGGAKSIQKEKNSNFVYINTLVDEKMYKALKLLNRTKFKPFVTHPARITEALHQYFEGGNPSILHCTPEIKDILFKHETEIVESRFKSSIRFLQHNKIIVGGVGVFALIVAYAYKMMHQSI